MLRPDIDRLDYGEHLMAPDGYELSAAIATTYSLDLSALLAVPVALVFGDTLDGDIKGEKLALVEAVSHLKDKIRVFHQNGCIKVPTEFNRLFTLLEPCVVAITPEHQYSSFHPKMWVIRFIESEPKTRKAKVCYRLIILSRNLTFDRSWDIAVSIDGILGSEVLEESKADPWIKLIKDLLGMSTGFSPGEQIRREISKIKWESPQKFKSVSLQAGGINYGIPIQQPARRGNSLLVMSPFLKKNALDWLASWVSGDKSERLLFSRSSELDAIGENALQDWTCYSMNEDIINSEELHQLTSNEPSTFPQKQDLHAKLIVFQKNSRVLWQLGSANVTDAALGTGTGKQHDDARNTEVMVMLEGVNSQIGPHVLKEEWLGEDSKGIFEEHVFTVLENGDGVANNEAILRQIEHKLVSSVWEQFCQPNSEENGFDILIKTDTSLLTVPHVATILVRQLSSSHYVPLAGEMRWTGTKETNISSFVIVKISLDGDDPLETSLVLNTNLEIEGGDTRSGKIFKEMVNTPEKLINYFSLLLQARPNKSEWLSIERLKDSGNATSWMSAEHPIFEKLLFAASRHPSQLKRISAMLARVKEADIHIPDDFLKLWQFFDKEI